MIVSRSMHPSYLSNSYLVADAQGGTAIIIDTGAPIEPLLEQVDAHGLSVTHVLNTHDHHDHTTYNVELQERFDVPLLGPDDFSPGQQLTTGDLAIEALDTPGHTPVHAAFLVNREACFTGDALFRGTVGGTLNGGPDGFVQLRSSIMDTLMGLEHDVRVYPGHTDASTVGEEWAANPFVRLWRGLDDEGTETVEVSGRECQLVLWAPDYDGGNKAWVRFDDGREAIVGGSMVTRLGAAPA